MAVTPDNSALIVAESYGNKLTAFEIAPDGSLSEAGCGAELGDGVPDGICIDEHAVVAQEWHGTEQMAGGERSGHVLVTRAPAPGAGWP